MVFVLALCASSHAQTAKSLAQVKTIYVETFGGADDGALLRKDLIRRLSKEKRFVLVQNEKGADAILTGAGEIWIRGYISINPKAPSTDRQPVFNGYLSLEVVGADRQPLWSWLATPERTPWTDFADNLAGLAAKKLIEASEAVPADVSTTGSNVSNPKTTLTGAGATFPAPLYRKWFQNFESSHAGTYVRYSPIGSQEGLESLAAGRLDFAGSDVVPEQVLGSGKGTSLRRFATVLGGVVPIYNIKGVTQDLRFTQEALADIYLGKVKRWDDPELLRSNRGVNLPDAEIVVIHRSDGSGTTWVWSDFLSKTSPAWLSQVGRGTTLHWPVGVGSERNDGVAEKVQTTSNSIGYVELAYAIQHDMSFGAVRNRSGEFMHADLDNLEEAANASGWSDEPGQSITDAPGKYAYPVAAFTWVVIPRNMQDAAKQTAVAELLRWVLTTGQKECSALGYAPLPRDVAEKQLRLLAGR